MATEIHAAEAGRRPTEVVVRDASADVAVVEAHGEFDVATADLLDRALRTYVAGRSRRVVVDLSSVSFLDSAALRVLIRQRERMALQGRWLVTRGATGQPRRLIDIGRVHYGVIV